MSLHLDEAIRGVVKRVREKGIWDKALDIIKQFGREKHETKSCCVATSGRFVIRLSGGVLDIISESHGQFHENLNVQIWYKEVLVFDATRTAWVEKYDERRVIRKKGGTGIILKKFRDGEWIDFLNIKNIRAILTPGVTTPKKTKRVPVEDDSTLASDFGLKP